MIFQKTVQIPSLNLLSWLKAQERFPKFYFKDSSKEIAACGNLLYYDHFPNIEQFPDSIKVFGFRRAVSLKDTFFVPTLQVEKTLDQTLYTQNLITQQSNVLEPNLNCTPLQNTLISVKFQSITPQYPEWKDLIRKSLSTDGLEKVVLSRTLRYKMLEFYSLYEVAVHLQKKTKNSSLYLFEQRPQFGYVGASPEILFHKKNDQIFVDALASTRKISHNPLHNQKYQNELMKWKKEQNEFLYVENFIKNSCQKFCNKIEITGPKILQTQDLYHLHSTLKGFLKPHIKQSEIFSSLHPTPAIVGFPQQTALEFLHQNGIPRPFYSSSYGWVSKNDTKFIVAIRGCGIKGKALELQSGVGVVPGSDPEKEWQELDDKLYLFQNNILKIQ